MILDPYDGYPPNVVARFKAWHYQNPHIYEHFKTLAYEMKATGRTRYSARTIIEVMRWHYNLQTRGNVFKVNDDFVPIYVRLLICDHPEFFGFFELRKVRSRGILSDEERWREGLAEEAWMEEWVEW